MRGLAAGSVARWRAVIGAALRYGAETRQLAAPTLQAVRQPDYEHAVFLTAAERDRLLACYTKWAAPVAVVLAFQGMRTHEALRLDWRVVNWRRRTLYIPESKTAEPAPCRCIVACG